MNNNCKLPPYFFNKPVKLYKDQKKEVDSW